MNIREMLEMEEKLYLSPYAARSVETRGRERFADPCDIRTEYQRDRDRIIHCKAFRRLKHKTQVFLAPAGDHYRTRLTHTLEVAQIARTVGTTDSVILQAETGVCSLASSWENIMEFRKDSTILGSCQSAA